MKSVLIIGGNSDIGFSTAKFFAKNGYDIHLASRNISELDKKKKKIEEKYNSNCLISMLDISSKESIKNFFINNTTSPNVIITAAGYLEIEETDYKKIIGNNYLYLVEFIELAIKNYLDQKNLNSIIGISSVAGERGKSHNNIYGSSKAGYSNYLNGLRQRLYQKKIHVLLVKPGYIKTKMTQHLNLPKILTTNPDHAGQKIYESFSKQKNELYVPKIWFFLIIIYKNIPEIFFKYLSKKTK
jgi:decaprenylphospho-beta-D-erythro-pentofuranosid-2-ulose 2-reductase